MNLFEQVVRQHSDRVEREQRMQDDIKSRDEKRKEITEELKSEIAQDITVIDDTKHKADLEEVFSDIQRKEIGRRLAKAEKKLQRGRK